MKYILKLFLYCHLLFICQTLIGQTEPKVQYLNPEVYQGTFVKKTVPLRDFVAPPFDGDIVRPERLGPDNPNPFDLNEKKNEEALPLGDDPVWQQIYTIDKEDNSTNKALNQNFAGINYTNVNPPDPCADVGPNHVIQMVNAGGGALFKIWDKNGNVLQDQMFFDALTGIGGFGDPIVLYDEVADRWMLSEFALNGNRLVIAITETADPLGAYYIYSYTMPLFPDYPKYAMWGDAYVVTTNEQSGGPNPAVYALDRTQMLAGTPGTFQRFVVPTLPGLTLQVLTPADVDGTTAPPANSNPLLLRMVDDGWDSSIPQDQLDLFEFDIDFATPSNTSITLIQEIATAPFDTEFCGYGLTGCIQQQGSGTTLFALNQLLMNRISYRNFTTHETMVVSHVTDVDGTNRGGVRWYELRKTPPSTSWVIHQQGTYAPTTDSNSRWMSTISINDEGTIGLAYNHAGPTAFPGIRYTGRAECDPLGTMTLPETIIFDGVAANGSNRYGDYSSLDVDPTSNEFWLTAQCNPATNWGTRVASFDINDCASEISFSNTFESLNENEADIVDPCLDYKEVGITIELGEETIINPTVTISMSGSAIAGEDYEAPSVLSVDLTPSQLSHTFIFKIFNDAYVESLEDIIIDYTLNANGGTATAGAEDQTATIEILDDDLPPAQSPGPLTTLFGEDFESNTLGGCTSSNLTGTDLFLTDTPANASSSGFNIPAVSSGSFVAYLNDNACFCDLFQTYLELPALDFSSATQAEMNFDYFFIKGTSNFETEDFKVVISTDNGSTYQLLYDAPGSGTWQNVTLDLDAYVGNANLLIRMIYGDNGENILGVAVDNIDVKTSNGSAVQVDVNSTMADEQYMGANSTVHFYDPSSGDVMLTIVNNSAHDYGCTVVEVDRAGTNPSALEFATTEVSEYLGSKTFKISPTNPNNSGSYDLSLYYEEAEIAAWETVTGNNRTAIEIVKVAGDNHISDVTPTNKDNYTISFNPTSISDFNADKIITSTISSGFSGFGIGIPFTDDPGGSNCAQFFTNTWVGPASANWYDDINYWSLGMFPDYCHHVIIPAGFDVTLGANQLGKGFTFTVDANATFKTDPTGLLDIVAPN